MILTNKPFLTPCMDRYYETLIYLRFFTIKEANKRISLFYPCDKVEDMGDAPILIDHF